jgi:molecular chaperone Hsp33
MRSTDTLRHFLFENSSVRGEVVHLDASWRAVIAQKEYPDPVRRLLGELVVAAVLLSATMRLTGSLTMQIKGDGPIKLLVVECKDGNSIRAMAHWDEAWQDDASFGALGKGQLVMTLDPTDSSERFQGIVELKGSSISETLEDYLRKSGDVNARLWLATNSDQAAGMLLQRSLDDDMDYDAFWQQALSVGCRITSSDLLELSLMDLISRFQNHYGIRVYADEAISFQCSCSQDRVNNVLRWLGEEEVHDVLRDIGTVHVECEFCGSVYEYDAVDVTQLFLGSTIVSQSDQKH